MPQHPHQTTSLPYTTTTNLPSSCNATTTKTTKTTTHTHHRLFFSEIFFIIIAIMASSITSASALTLSEKINHALALHKQGVDLEQAITVYESVLIDLVPSAEGVGKIAATLHSNVGSLYMNKGEFETAKTHFLSAIDCDPTNPTSEVNLAILLSSKLDDQRKALIHCARALKLDPTMVKGMHVMGIIMQNMQREEDAEKYFTMAERAAKEAAAAEATASAAATSPVDLDDGGSSSSNSQDEEVIGMGQGKSWSDAYRLMSAKVGDEYTAEGEEESAASPLTMKCLSERPLIFQVSGLLSAEDCDHIINRASAKLEKSFVMGGKVVRNLEGAEDPGVAVDAYGEASQLAAKGEEMKNGNNENNNSEPSAGDVDDNVYRSSYNAWLSNTDDVAAKLQRRLAAVTGLPLALFQQKSEELQVVKYEAGGFFKVHQDSSAFHPRLFTALLYLNDLSPDLGGQTWFPFAHQDTFSLSVEEAITVALEAREKDPEGSVSQGIAVSPVKGDGIIFFNHLKNGELDVAAVHAGLPVKKSKSYGADERIEKHIANYWVELDRKFLAET